MPMSALASMTSIPSTRASKNGQRPYMSPSIDAPNCPTTASRPDPLPNQPGSMCRLWDQANIHGMARSESTSRLSERDTGREPICIRSMTSTGVAAWKNSVKTGSS